MKGLLIAIQFMTRIPTPRITVSTEEYSASIRWFPAVGLIVGTIVAAGSWLGGQIDPWVGAVIGLACWVGVTGALHLDGLGDVADASGAAHKGIDKERLKAIMTDPHIGSFGTVAIVLQLLAKLVFLHLIIEQNLTTYLILIPFAARIGPLLWGRWLPPLHQGLGTTFSQNSRNFDITIWALVLLAAIFLVPALVCTPALLLFWACWLKQKLGGISGDGHGAGIEITETGALLALLTVQFV